MPGGPNPAFLSVPWLLVLGTASTDAVPLQGSLTPPKLPPGVGLEIHLKFRDDLRVRVGSEGPPVHAAVLSLLEGHGATLEPLIRAPETDIDRWLKRAFRRSDRAQPDLKGMARLRFAEPKSAPFLAAVARDLTQFPEVEWVHLEPIGVPPPTDLPTASSDFRPRQTYVDPDPGMATTWAATLQVTGSSIRMYDCEYGWDPTHEDLLGQNLRREPNHTESPEVRARGFHDHGTAVVGTWAAADNDYGITGLVSDADVRLYSEWTVEGGLRRVDAVASAMADARPGDIVILEMQTFGPEDGYGPAEISPAIWQLTRAATDAGIIVVAAAGNGSEDLDSEDYQAYRDRGNSGAIIVGAGLPEVLHRNAGYSTYGARVDIQGWGSDIMTLGYGSLARFGDDERQTYVGGFGGTSGATALVAAAVALVQDYARSRYEVTLSAATLKEILQITGKPQSNPTRPIGPHPDVEAALFEVDARAPSIDELIVPEGREGTWVELRASASSRDGLNLRYQWTLGAQVLRGPEVGFVPSDDGDVAVVLAVEDSRGFTRRSETTLVVANVPPELAPLEIPRALEETTWSLRLEALDPGDDQIRFELRDGPDGMELVDEATLRWTPGLEDARLGTTSFEIAVFDEDGGSSTSRLSVPVDFVDLDGDGVADSWELQVGYDPANPADASEDRDRDGRSVYDEFLGRTDPSVYDGPQGLELLSPIDTVVGGEPTLLVRNPEGDAQLGIRFEWNVRGQWVRGPVTPVSRPGSSTRFRTGRIFEENARVAWRARAVDAFIEGPVSEAAEFVFSDVDEAPAVPTLVDARLFGGDLRATLTVDVGPDPEGRPVTIEIDIIREQVKLQTLDGLRPTEGRVVTEIAIDDESGDLFWTARAVDAGGIASASAPPRLLRRDQGCTCLGPPSGPSSRLAGLGVLGLVLLLRTRRRRG